MTKRTKYPRAPEDEEREKAIPGASRRRPGQAEPQELTFQKWFKPGEYWPYFGSNDG